MARFPCRTTSSCKRIRAGAVKSTRVGELEATSLATMPETPSESRVVPAIGATIARREPMMRLNRVDFPTLGRPTSTTDGNFGGILSDIDDHLAFTLTA